MTSAAPHGEAAACQAALEAAIAGGTLPALESVSAALLDEALRALVKQHAAAALPLLERLADGAADKEQRRAARRALYRLAQSGVRPPRAGAVTPVRPVVTREAEHAVRAWLSGIDGSGSRAAWILFEGGLGGGLRLCSLILNDEAGIMDAAGGPIARKRLEAELRGLRASQKLPWVEVDGRRACALVAAALALHERLGTVPPPEFARWRRLFAAGPLLGEVQQLPGEAQPKASRADTREKLPVASTPAEADPTLLDRSTSLLDLPELMGWFVDPARVQHEALALLQTRESRLVVSEQIKAAREASIIDGVIEAQLSPPARQRWANRLREMADIFALTGRDEPAALARATAEALADLERPATALPFARALAGRGLEMATEVALGRARLDDVSRAPARRARS
ncbi:MAG TPA: hypothetical protein VL086_16145 [Candidatus Nitrosotalea sp.]|nr:hypothetical protein [Candidatus Nitrosotalea sp.]